MFVAVAAQIARRSVTFGSDSPRSHLRTAPSERAMTRARALAPPCPSTTLLRRAGNAWASVEKGLLRNGFRRCAHAVAQIWSRIYGRNGQKSIKKHKNTIEAHKKTKIDGSRLPLVARRYLDWGRGPCRGLLREILRRMRAAAGTVARGRNSSDLVACGGIGFLNLKTPIMRTPGAGPAASSRVDARALRCVYRHGRKWRNW